MTEKSQAELEALHRNVVTYGRFAVTMLEESLNAFQQQDTSQAERVCEKKKELKANFIPLEDSLFQYLALYQPVARDMREIAASIRLIYNFERVGRMGFDIAQTVMVLSRSCELYDSPSLISMGTLVTRMIEDALGAFEERSVTNIISMQERDNEVDILYCKIMAEFIGKMQEDKDHIPILTRYVIIDRYLERCGDQACNMAEMVQYMVTGERIEIQS